MGQIPARDLSNSGHNENGLCRAAAINMWNHVQRNTHIQVSNEGGFNESNGGIEACLALECRFEEAQKCRESNISVPSHERQADNEIFQARS